MNSNNLQEEAEAFDARISERIKHGLIPDVRKAAKIDWFYNNPWRRPEYVKMVFGDYIEFARLHLPTPPARIVEIGSGLGHMCVELSRGGYHATGIELSPESVKIAQRYYASLGGSDRGPGSAVYVNDDFMTWMPSEPFDAACFFLTLHHFDDPDAVIERVKKMLKPGGSIIVIEPARDLFSLRDASVAALIRILLSFRGNWYEPVQSPANLKELSDYVHEVLNEYKEAKEKNEHEQSPHDNSSFAADMLQALRKHFDQSALRHGNTLTPRLLGGIRGASEEETLRMASFLKLFDDFATQENILEPGVIYFAGKLKKGV